MKLETCAALRYGGWITRYEDCDADIVAFRPGRSEVLAVECERSIRNVRRNIRKDFEHGCDYLLIVCPDAALVATITDIIAAFPVDVASRTNVMPMQMCTAQYFMGFLAEDYSKSKVQTPCTR